jgi:hypothetical protein
VDGDWSLTAFHFSLLESTSVFDAYTITVFSPAQWEQVEMPSTRASMVGQTDDFVFTISGPGSAPPEGIQFDNGFQLARDSFEILE